MRNIPGLGQDILDRAGTLTAQAATRLEAINKPGGTPPRADMVPPVVVNGVAKLRLFSTIDPDGGYWGTSAAEFVDALDQLDSAITGVELHINSRGGSVWDGLTMLNSLRQLDVPVTAIVEGIAASAASFIACACDETVMMPNSQMMIHDAMGVCAGQAVDMHAYGDFLGDSSDNLAAIYAAKAGGTAADWRDTMQNSGLLGQWYTADQAVEAGLADRVGGAADEDDEPQNKAPEPAQSACGCGPQIEGVEHKDECSTKAAPIPAEPVEAFHDYSRRHGRNTRKHRVA
jgi:ATP-dependent protease ClpP protease subunit